MKNVNYTIQIKSLITGLVMTGVIVIMQPLALKAQPPKINFLLKKVENLLEITSDFRARVSMTQKKVKQGIKKVDMIYYRQDKTDSFLIVITAPNAEKGNGYLRVGENFWMYRQNTRTFQHINRDENIAGTEARGDDFEKRKLTELYTAAKDKNGNDIITETMLGSIPVYKFEVTAKVNDVDYPKKTYWIRRDNYLPLKEQSFSLSNTLMETAYYRKYIVLEKRYVCVEMMFIDEFEKGNKTLVEISGISTVRLSDKIFRKDYLENLSK